METTFIYGLNDPETGECRYVGKANDPHDRLFGPGGHLRKCGKAKYHCAYWIRSLQARGLVPHLEILQEVPKTEWELWERVWIKASRKIGMNLTNGTDGGDCGPSWAGKKHTLDWCKAVSARMSGEKNPMFGRTGDQNPAFGKALSTERRAYLSALWSGEKSPMFGRPKSPEISAKCRRKIGGASSNFYGVSWHSAAGKWEANLRIENKKVYLGCFADEIEAAKAYDSAAKSRCGAHAKLNFPD